MSSKPIKVSLGELRADPFRIVLQMSPLWSKLAEEFSDVASRMLDDESRDLAIEIGKMMIENISSHTTFEDYTGRLSSRQKTWRYWVGRPPGVKEGRWSVTVGLHRPRYVHPSIGRPVERYALGIERGDLPRSRLGKEARGRVERWAEARGRTPEEARRISRALHIFGTDAYPFFLPAARATLKGAVKLLDNSGTEWRDNVESYFRHDAL